MTTDGGHPPQWQRWTITLDDRVLVAYISNDYESEMLMRDLIDEAMPVSIVVEYADPPR